MQAGFDLSNISVENWTKLMARFELSDATLTPSGWVWHTESFANDNRVVTANNPITGEYFYKSAIRENQKGFVAYVGIEGDEAFVTAFFEAFKEVAEFIKDSEFGKRSFI